MLHEPFFTAFRRPLAWLAFGTTLLSACAAPVPPTPGAPAPAIGPAPARVMPAPETAPPGSPAPLAQAPLPPPAVPAPPMEAGPSIAPLLRYAERLRGLSAAELTLEIASLGDPGADTQRQMQLALALMHTHQPVDTARALGLLQRVATANAGDSTAVRPLARLLAGRLLEQRKLEDANDRQAQQLRDQQRRIDQLTDRLEAMRAIERSLNTRPPAAPRPPAQGTTP